MSASIAEADRIIIETEDGEVYEFWCDGVEVEYDKDYENFGPGEINTRVAQVDATVRGSIRRAERP